MVDYSDWDSFWIQIRWRISEWDIKCKGCTESRNGERWYKDEYLLQSRMFISNYIRYLLLIYIF